jgi:hypothetical protein
MGDGGKAGAAGVKPVTMRLTPMIGMAKHMRKRSLFFILFSPLKTTLPGILMRRQR